MIQGRCFMLALFYANEYWTNHQPSTINPQPSLQPKIVEIKPLFWILAYDCFQKINIFLHRR